MTPSKRSWTGFSCDHWQRSLVMTAFLALQQYTTYEALGGVVGGHPRIGGGGGGLGGQDSTGGGSPPHPQHPAHLSQQQQMYSHQVI